MRLAERREVTEYSAKNETSRVERSGEITEYFAERVRRAEYRVE
jgi:hypothetical protein